MHDDGSFRSAIDGILAGNVHLLFSMVIITLAGSLLLLFNSVEHTSNGNTGTWVNIFLNNFGDVVLASI